MEEYVINNNKIDLKPAALYPKPELVNHEEMHHTIDRINEALDDDRAHNIAITAPYDSGKTSILEYIFSEREKKYPCIIKCKNWCVNKINRYKIKHFLSPKLLFKIKDYKKISLTNFFITMENDQTGEKIDSLNSELEKSIIEQLLLTPEAKNKLPDSRINRIYNISPMKKIFLYILELLVYIAIFFNNSTILNLNIGWKWEIFIVSSVIIWMSNSFLCHQIPKLTTSFKVKKAGIGMELSDEKSLFNKYEEELIYFFRRSKIRYVIFEDLDRFDMPLIFQNLRELNIRLNESNIPVTFVYALRDSIFSRPKIKTENKISEDSKDKAKNATSENSKDRMENTNTVIQKSKFFDYIIPIFPIHSYFNSKNQILSKLNSDYYSEMHKIRISEKYITGVGFYISDVRTISAIISELDIYVHQLEKSNERDIDYNKLFAAIVYKNIYPEDFSNLQYVSQDENTSNIGYLIRNIEDLRNALLNGSIHILQENIQRKQREFEELRKLTIEDIVALMKIRFETVMKRYNSRYIIINNQHYDRDNIEDFYKLILDKENPGDIKSEYSYENIESNEFYNNKYEKNLFRDFVVENKKAVSDYLTDLNKEIVILETKLKIKRHDFSKETFAELFGHLVDKEYINDLSIKKTMKESILYVFDNPLLRYLISEGLIDIDLFEYISPTFFEGLSQNDFNFVNKVARYEIIEDTKLDKPEKVLEVLTEFVSNMSYAYSYQLFIELIRDGRKKDYLDLLGTVRSKNDTDFIFRCFNSNTSLINEEIVEIVFNEWSEVFKDVYLSNDNTAISNFLKASLNMLTKSKPNNSFFNKLDEYKVLDNSLFLNELLKYNYKDKIFKNYKHYYENLNNIVNDVNLNTDVIFENNWFDKNNENFAFFMGSYDNSLKQSNSKIKLSSMFDMEHIQYFIENKYKESPMPVDELFTYLSIVRDYGVFKIGKEEFNRKKYSEVLHFVSQIKPKTILSKDDQLSIFKLLGLEDLSSMDELKNLDDETKKLDESISSLIYNGMIIVTFPFFESWEKSQFKIRKTIISCLLNLEQQDEFDIDKIYSKIRYITIRDWIEKSNNEKIIIEKVNNDEGFDIQKFEIENIDNNDRKNRLILKLAMNFNFDKLKQLLLSSIVEDSHEKLKILGIICSKFPKKYELSTISIFLFNDGNMLSSWVGKNNGNIFNSDADDELKNLLVEFFDRKNILSSNKKFLKSASVKEYFI